MAKVEIFSKPKMDADLAASGLKWVTPPKMSYKVTVDFDDKIFKAIKSDDIILEDMNRALQKVYDQTCDAIKSKLKAFDKLVDTMIDKNAPEAEIAKQLTGLCNSIENDRSIGEDASKTIVAKVWKAYVAKKKEYLKYGIKITATIVGTAAGLVTSIVLTAGSGFSGGAGTVFAVLGMVKSGITLAKEIGSAAMEIEAAQKILAAQLQIVNAEVRNSKAKKANELVAAAANQLLGVSQPCIKNCQSQMDTVEKKLLGIEIKTHEASKTLNKILDKEEELKKDFMKEVIEKLGKHSSSKARDQIKLIEGRLDGLIGGPFRTVQTQIDVIHKLHGRFLKAEEVTKKMRPVVDRLAGMRTIDEVVFENLLILVDIPLAFLDGNAMTSDAKKIVDGLTPVLTSMAYDKVKGKALDGTFLV